MSAILFWFIICHGLLELALLAAIYWLLCELREKGEK